NFAGYDLRKPDSIPDLIQTGVNQPTRIGEWLKEFQNYEANGSLPTVEFVRLPNDHTATNTIGAPTPRASVADNDYALGQLVDAVSHSKDWGSTAIFVIEDDAQEGPDHVDAHRTVAQVISPYTQTGKVDSTFYSQVSVLRTIEQIVGIGPMTQFDAAARPLLNGFSNTPNMKPYTAIVPTQDVHEKNPVNPPMASVAPKSLDQVATLVDQNEPLENQVLWAYYGTGPMPAPRTSLHDLSVPGSEDSATTDDSGLDTGNVLSQPDVTDANLRADVTNTPTLQGGGAPPTTSSTTMPSGSFSGPFSDLSGPGHATTGVSSDSSSGTLSAVEFVRLSNDQTATNTVGATTPRP